MSKGHLPQKLNKSGGLDVDCQEDAIDANDTETNRRAVACCQQVSSKNVQNHCKCQLPTLIRIRLRA